MCFPKSKDVREKAISLHNQLTTSNANLIVEFVQAFFEIFNSELPSESSNPNEAHILVKCCQVLINYNQISDETKLSKLALECIKICHIPIIYHFQSNLYLTFLHKRFDEKEASEFVDKNCVSMVNLVFVTGLSNEIKLSIVKTLTKLNARKFINCFVREIYASLDQQVAQLKAVTPVEFAIFKTAEGVLYDMSVVKAAADANIDKNTKRENKLYSFKEQMAEMELRKELETKNKDDLDLSKLTKKQEEVFKVQMTKEEDIRNRLRLLNQKFTFNLDVLLAIMESNSLVACIYFKEITFTLVNLFTSVLCYDKVTNFTLKISHNMMLSPATCNDVEYVKFVDTAAYTLVRLFPNPSSPDSDLCKLIARLVDFLYRRTCPNSGTGYDEKLNRLALQNRLTTPAFSFIFPLLRYVLLNLTPSNTITYDQTVDRCLQIIGQHSLHRTDSTDSNEGLKNPQNMPIKLTLETLIKFMEKDLIDHEKTAASVLINNVSCINGNLGCGTATTSDIFVLLNSLTHRNDLIRLTCIQALDNLSVNVLPHLEEGHCKEKLKHRVFIGRFDTQPECQTYANQIFEKCSFETNGKMLENIFDDDIENANSVLVIPLSDAYRYLLQR